MAIELIPLVGGISGCTGFTPTSWNYSNESTSSNYTEGTNLYSLAEVGETITLIDNDYLKITYNRQSSSNNNLNGWYKSPNGDISILSVNSGWDPSSFFGIVFALDEDNQTGGFFACLQYNYYGSERYYISNNSQAQGSNQAYIAIKNSIAPAYNWQSVTSLTGKGVTKGLSILKVESINDGNAVNDGTASDFTNSPLACNVGDIIASLQPIVDGDPTKVAVKYTIPDLTDTAYTSVKLVAKKKKIPKNKTDGDKIIDLSPSSGGVVVSGLEQLTKYYFVIFVEDSVGNKADSEPKSITTGKKDGILIDRISVMQATMDSDGIKDSVSVTQI